MSVTNFPCKAKPKRKRYRKPSLHIVTRVLKLHHAGYQLPVICQRLNLRLPSVLSFILHDNELTKWYQENRTCESEQQIHDIESLSNLVNIENVNVVNFLFKAKSWLLSKYQPERFGDRTTTDVNVKASTPILNITLNDPVLLSHQSKETDDYTIDCDSSSDLKLLPGKKHA